MKIIKSKGFKIFVIAFVSTLIALALVLFGVSLYLKLNKDKEENPIVPEINIENPLAFSIDAWDGTTVSELDYISEFAGRKANTITINSAKSFMYFVNQVNTGEIDYDEIKTIYLNTSIDLQGHTIDSIGTKEHPFEGSFDGGYYTIYNANINGNGLFGTTKNAEIKNIGLYNATVNTTEEISGMLIGKATNTNVTNTFVRNTETIKANKIGGLVGEYISENGEHTITNSFVDAEIEAEEIGGLVHTINVNLSNNEQKTITQCYYTFGEKEFLTSNNESLVSFPNVLKPDVVSDLYGWCQTGDWQDYDYLENSTELEFNYPIQSEFVKVYLTGSYYEAVVIGDDVVNVSTISKAFDEAEKSSSATVNLIVDKIFMETGVDLSSNITITLNCLQNTTIIRGKNNAGSLFSAGSSSTLILGETQNSNDEEHPTLTIDGNRTYVEENNLKSDVLISAIKLKVYNNVILKNNINNINGEGGAVCVRNSSELTILSAEISNCSAIKGGAIYSTGIINIQGSKFINNSETNGAVYGETIQIENCDFTKQDNAIVVLNSLIVDAGNVFNSESSHHIELKIDATARVTSDLSEVLKIYKNSISYFNGFNTDNSYKILNQAGLSFSQASMIEVVNIPLDCVFNLKDVLQYDGIIVKTVQKPTVVGGTYYYNQEEQSVGLNGYDEDYMTISEYSATNVGEYEVQILVKNYYKWSDETSKPVSEQTKLTVEWSIEYPALNLYDYKNEIAQTVYPGYNTIETYDGNVSTNSISLEIPTRNGYTFNGWFTQDGTKVILENGNLISDISDYTNHNSEGNAVWGMISSKDLFEQWTINKYTVTWVNDDGTVLETDENVTYGETVSYDGSTPTKAPTIQYSYEFKGWVKDLGTEIVDLEDEIVESNVTYKAAYTGVVNKHTVTFEVNSSGYGLVNAVSMFVDYNTPIKVDGNTIKIGSVIVTATQAEPTPEHTFAFYHWEINGVSVSGGETVTADITITAVFTATSNTYIVTWVNYDDSVLKTDVVEYGETPEYNGETPTREADAEYRYTFAGWDPVVTSVDGHATYKATYSRTTIDYSISYELNGGVVDGENPTTYNCETEEFTLVNPTKVGYTFIGWTGTGIEEAEMTVTIVTDTTGNLEFTANWEANSDTAYTVYHYLENMNVEEELSTNNSTLKDTDNLTGTTASEVTPEVKDYVGFTAPTTQTVVISADGSTEVYYYYTRNTYEVKVVSSNTEHGSVNNASVVVDYETEITVDGNKLTIGTEEFTATAKEANAQYTYAFVSWNYEGNKVLAEMTITAEFSVTTNSYTVTWVDYNDSVLEENVFAYGTMPTYNGETDPTREADAEYRYTFAGWDPVVTEVVGNATYKATYTRTAIDYSISYELNGGVVEGENPTTYNCETEEFTLVNPTKVGYTFIGWTGTGIEEAQMTVTIVTGTIGNLEFTANWEANSDTAYTVYHYLENMNVEEELSTSNSTLKDTDNLTGTTASEVTPSVKDYVGFTAPTTQTVVISADGSTEVYYYYTRNQYTVTVQSNSETYGTVDKSSVTVDYGTELTVNKNKLTVGTEVFTAIASRDGFLGQYEFNGWSYEGGKVLADITIIARFRDSSHDYIDPDGWT